MHRLLTQKPAILCRFDRLQAAHLQRTSDPARLDPTERETGALHVLPRGEVHHHHSGYRRLFHVQKSHQVHPLVLSFFQQRVNPPVIVPQKPQRVHVSQHPRHHPRNPRHRL